MVSGFQKLELKDNLNTVSFVMKPLKSIAVLLLEYNIRGYDIPKKKMWALSFVRLLTAAPQTISEEQFQVSLCRSLPKIISHGHSSVFQAQNPLDCRLRRA